VDSAIAARNDSRDAASPTAMRLLDLSQPLFDGAPNCPVHPPVSFRRTADHPRDGWRMEEIAMATHTGSHLDAPLHKISGGKSIDALPLETFVGPARIADLRGLAADAAIGGALLAAKLPGLARGDIALLATGWGDRRAKSDEWLRHSPFVDPDGAHWLVAHGVRGVGIDHYSIGGAGPLNAETHTILLGAGVWVVEELKFPAEVFALPPPVKFWALPMNWPGGSGAFCRPVIEAE
jgi:kynurenine formamidase